MPRKGLDEPGNFNRTCGFMGLCRQRHKPGHPAGEIEGSWAIDKESGEMLSHITKKALPDYEKSGLQKDPGLKELLERSYHDLKVTYVHAQCAMHCNRKGWTFQALDPNKRLTAPSTNGGSSNGSSKHGASSDGGSSSDNNEWCQQ